MLFSVRTISVNKLSFAFHVAEENMSQVFHLSSVALKALSKIKSTNKELCIFCLQQILFFKVDFVSLAMCCGKKSQVFFPCWSKALTDFIYLFMLFFSCQVQSSFIEKLFHFWRAGTANR